MFPFDFIEIFGIPVHEWSLIVLVSTFLIAFYLLKKLKFLNRLVVSSALYVFGVHSYEACWIFLLGNNPIIYIFTSLFLLLIILYYNIKGKFLCINKIFLLLLCLHIVIFLFQFYFGWFEAVKLWIEGNGSDPHNWIWLINKGLGNWTWLILLKPPFKEKRKKIND